MSVKCTHNVDGRRCRNPAFWIGHYPLDPNRYAYCGRHKAGMARLNPIWQWEPHDSSNAKEVKP